MAINVENLEGSDSKLYSNITCDQIRIAEDKLRLKLGKYIDQIKKNSEWTTWLGLLISSGATLVTADINKDVIFTANTWLFIFKVVTIVSIGMLIWSVIRNVLCRVNVDKIVDDFKSKE